MKKISIKVYLPQDVIKTIKKSKNTNYITLEVESPYSKHIAIDLAPNICKYKIDNKIVTKQLSLFGKIKEFLNCLFKNPEMLKRIM